jgi:hypothetical protein
MIELHGTLTLADFARFHYFHYLRRMWPILILVLLLAAAIIGLIIAVPNPGIIANSLPLLILFAVWICLIGVSPFLAARRQLAKQPYLREPLTQIFTAEGIKASAPSTSSDIKWNIVQNVRETGCLFLLYYAPNQALLVPKRFFSTSDQMDSWRMITETGIAPRQISQLAFIGKWF